MTPDQAAARLGGLRVTVVREHPAGHVATTERGEMLITNTTARAYVPDVDDAPVRATEPDDSAAEALPAPRGRRKAG